jgi:sugar phosphate isomerase/epimerase
MQNAKLLTIGVSPAYFLSRFGQSFQIEDVTASLQEIAALGYTAFQMEAFTATAAKRWSGKALLQLTDQAGRLNLQPSQFVAHWYGETLSSIAQLRSRQSLELLRTVVNAVVAQTSVPVVTLPLVPFKEQNVRFEEAWKALVESIAAAAEVIAEAGAAPALEIVPGSLAGSSFGFLRLVEEIPQVDIGFNLDSGHATAAGEIIQHVITRVGSRLVGTHLCDNLGKENLSNCPGSGSVPWEATIAGLLEIGYTGSFDIEILCEKHKLKSEYSQGLQFIRSILKQMAYRSTA